jgi:hypothetical protein
LLKTEARDQLQQNQNNKIKLILNIKKTKEERKKENQMIEINRRLKRQLA